MITRSEKDMQVMSSDTPLAPEVMEMVERMRDNEATDAALYTALAARAKSPANRSILRKIADDEKKHMALWAELSRSPARANRRKVFAYSLLSRLFGITFTINLMESGEVDAVKAYTELGEHVPVALSVLDDESRHEAELSAMIVEDGLSYISSMILGLNDALVELTGALAGFTLALDNNALIGLAGFITGVAATLSMAASEYLSKKADGNERQPLKAATYTGLAYMFTVALLLLPYGVLSSPMLALMFCLVNAGLIILGFTYFVAVVRKESFLKGFREMICISFSVAFISFLIGWGARVWLNLDV